MPSGYDDLMLSLRKARSVLCLLLAVATAIAAVIPSQACACTPTHPCASSVVRQELGQPTASVPDPPLCERTCCRPKGTIKADCCCRETFAVRPAIVRTEFTRCPCLRCACEDPIQSPKTPVISQPMLVAVTDAPFAFPAYPAIPDERHTSRFDSIDLSSPTDLIVALCRFTC